MYNARRNEFTQHVSLFFFLEVSNDRLLRKLDIKDILLFQKQE